MDSLFLCLALKQLAIALHYLYNLFIVKYYLEIKIRYVHTRVDLLKHHKCTIYKYIK